MNKIVRIRSAAWRHNRNTRYGLVTKAANRMRTGSDRPAQMPDAWRIKELAQLALAFRYGPKPHD